MTSTCSPSIVAAPSYSAAYSWGICNGKPFGDFVPVQDGSDFTAHCSSSDGFYYQSPQVHLDAKECALLQPSEYIAGDCKSFNDAMSAIISDTCYSSIEKVCSLAVKENPPFKCSRKKYSNVIVVLANSFANTNLVWGLAGTIVATILVTMYKGYADRPIVVAA